MATNPTKYPVTLDVDYKPQHDRVTSLLRFFWALPVLVLISILSGTGVANEAGKQATVNGGGIAGGLTAATALMILFRQKYPRWWFDFVLELNRFSNRVAAYLLLLTDLYPSTTETQAVHLQIAYPDVKKDLNKWLPLIKWFLAIPHYFVLFFLAIGAMFATVIAWFSILFTGTYPKSLFDFVVGVGRWSMRVNAYAFLLTTDAYPPFTLQ